MLAMRPIAVIKRLQSIDKIVNCGTGGSVYGSTVIAAVVTFSVCIVIISFLFFRKQFFMRRPNQYKPSGLSNEKRI